MICKEMFKKKIVLTIWNASVIIYIVKSEPDKQHKLIMFLLIIAYLIIEPLPV